jgi:formylglycine-generating enzyme required for sulfatase activity
VLAPQLGLFPIGHDPHSGLHEFAHVDSGTIPARNSLGYLDYAPECGIVLVLIPAQRFRMGAISPWEFHAIGEVNLDPDAESTEAPPHDVELAAYFVSKYELTRPQWTRLSQQDRRFPQARRPDPEFLTPEDKLLLLPYVDLLPMEAVSWRDASEVLRWYGLGLPTEAQWECAARAGTQTRWWGGNSLEALRLAEHLKGYGPRHPVGAWQPNPFGLYDTCGNLSEWCSDRIMDEDYANPVEPDTGKRLYTERGSTLIFRGGNSLLEPKYARVSMRFYALPDQRVDFLGVRPARAVF